MCARPRGIHREAVSPRVQLRLSDQPRELDEVDAAEGAMAAARKRLQIRKRGLRPAHLQPPPEEAPQCSFIDVVRAIEPKKAEQHVYSFIQNLKTRAAAAATSHAGAAGATAPAIAGSEAAPQSGRSSGEGASPVPAGMSRTHMPVHQPHSQRQASALLPHPP
jgi:hypothetical protein